VRGRKESIFLCPQYHDAVSIPTARQEQRAMRTENDISKQIVSCAIEVHKFEEKQSETASIEL
jgi:hypothetical protein